MDRRLVSFFPFLACHYCPHLPHLTMDLRVAQVVPGFLVLVANLIDGYPAV